jgi:hypothetical protein
MSTTRYCFLVLVGTTWACGEPHGSSAPSTAEKPMPYGSAASGATASTLPGATAAPPGATAAPPGTSGQPSQCAIQAPQPLGPQSDSINYFDAIRVNDKYVFWSTVNGSFSGIHRMLKSRPIDVPRLTDQLIVPQPDGSRFTNLAVDNDHLFWLETDTDRKPLHISRANTDGSEVTHLVDFADPCVELVTLAIDSCDVYYQERGEHCGGLVATFKRVPKAGGTPTAISTVENDLVTKIEVDELGIYYFNGNWLRRVPKNGGPLETLTGDEQEGLQFDVDDRFIYLSFSDLANQYILDKSGNTVATYTPPAAGPATVMVGGNGQMFFTSGPNSLEYFITARDFDGSFRFVGWVPTTTLALDEQYLYFSDGSLVYRVCRSL